MKGEEYGPYSFCFEVYFMRENKFQSDLIKELKARFPGCVIKKQPTTFHQGDPDLLILYKDRWAILECKKSANAPYRPNQEYYLAEYDKMSFARTIYPENKEEVLDDLQRAFESRR